MAEDLGIRIHITPDIQRQEVINALDKACKAGLAIKNVSIKHVQIGSATLSQKAMKPLRDSVQSTIDSRKYSINSVTLKRIDAKAALNALKIDIQNLVGNPNIGGGGGGGGGGTNSVSSQLNSLNSGIAQFEKTYSGFMGNYIKDLSNSGDISKILKAGDLTNQLESIKTATKGMYDAYNNGSDVAISDINNQKKALADLKAEIIAAAAEASNIDAGVVVNEKAIDNLTNKVKNYQKSNPLVMNTNQTFAQTGKTYKDTIDDIIASLESMRAAGSYSAEELKNLENTFSSLSIDADNNGLGSKTDIGKDYDSTLKSAEAELKSLKSLYDQLDGEAKASGVTAPQSLNGLGTKISEIETLLNSLRNAGEGTYKGIADQISACVVEANGFGDAAKRSISDSTKSLKPALELLNKVKESMKNNSNAMKNTGYAKEYNEIVNRLKTMMSGTSLDSQELDKLRTRFENLEVAIESSGNSGKTTFDKIKDGAIGVIGKLVSVQRVFQLLKQALREMYEAVKEVDDSMTQLRIVTGATDKQMSEFFDGAAESAKNLGASLSNVLTSIETFSRLGYSLEESLELSEAATIMSNVAGTTVDEATEGLTAIVKGYGIASSEISGVLDSLVSVGQNYAVSASELMQALQNGGATLQAGGNTLEQSIALIAAGNASIQNASTVGNALKTTSMRIRGATAELEEAGEEVDDLVSSTSKMREEILALSGVDIMIDSDTFKSTYDILLEIANVWDSLSDINQAALLEDLAGKRNASTIKSVISNVDDMTGAYEDATNSSGIAAEANEEYLDSISGALGRLNTQFQVFSSTVLNSDLIVGGINFLTKVLELLTDIVDVLGVIGTLATGVGVVSLIKIIPEVINSLTTTALVPLGTAAGVASGSIGIVVAGVAALAVALSALFANLESSPSLDDLVGDLEGSIKEYESITDTVNSLTDELDTLKARQEELNKLRTDGSMSTAELTELATLEAQTKELERQLEIDKEKQRIAGQQQDEDALEVLTSTQKSNYATTIASSEYKLNLPSYSGLTTSATTSSVEASGSQQYQTPQPYIDIRADVTVTEELINATNKLKDLEKERLKIQTDIDNAKRDEDGNLIDPDSYQEATENLKEVDAEIETVRGDCVDLGEKINSALDSMSADAVENNKEAVTSAYSALNDYLGYIAALDDEITNSALEKFSGQYVLSASYQRGELFNDGLFEDVLSQLTDLGREKFDEFYAAYGDNYLTATTLMSGFNDWIEGTGEFAEDLADAMDDVVDETEDLDDASSDVASNFEALWDSTDFSDAKSELTELANSTGITSDKIWELAENNKSLSDLLETTGISARYTAECFEYMAQGGDIADKLTSEFVALDAALSQMEQSSKDANDAYTKLQESLGNGDYDDNFENYQSTYDALEKAMNSDTAEYGLDFRRQAALFIGTEAAADPIEDVIKRVKELKKLFSEDDNGLGFIQELYKAQDAMGESWISLEDGVYKFDIDPDDFSKIADYFGTTEEAVASLVEAWGMFGDYAPYDIEELEDAISSFGTAIDDTADSAFAMTKQSLRALLESMGYDELEAEMIINDLIEQSDRLQVLDFSVTEPDELNSLLESLQDLGAIDDLGNIDALGLSSYLAKEFGLSVDEIEAFLAKIDELDGVTINGLGDEVEVSTEYIGDVLERASNAVDDYKEHFNSDYEFDLDTDSVSKASEQLDEVQKNLEQCVTSDGTIDIQACGGEETLDLFLGLYYQKQLLTAPAVMSIDTSTLSGDTKYAIELLQQYQAKKWEIEAKESIGLNVDVESEELYAVQAEIDNLNKLNPDVFVNLGIDPTSQATIDATIANITEVASNADVQVTADMIWTNNDTEVNKFISQKHDARGTVNYSVAMTQTATNTLAKWRNQKGTITYKVGFGVSSTGTAHAFGTAFASGTAYKSGNWGTKSGGVALMGELGPELIVRDGKFFTVGDDSAEIVPYKRNDIIFNAEQTRQILENGKITNGAKRGHAYASGTAFVSGGVSATNPATGKTYKSSSANSKTVSGNSSSKSNSNSKSSKSNSDSFEPEDFDWIEVLIDRIEAKIESLETTADNAYKTFSTRNSALKSEITELSNEITAQQGAYEAYMNAANNVGLSNTYKGLVQDGSLDITTITNETLADQIKEYQEWYEKALDAKQAIEELGVTLSEVYEDLFNNVADQFDYVIDRINNKVDQLELYVDLIEKQGHIVSGAYYEELITQESKKLSQLEQEQKSLIDSLNNAIDYGAVQKGSEAWYEMQSEIDDVTASIVESKQALAELSNNLRQLSWDQFDYLEEQFDNLITEADFLAKTFDENDLFNDSGKMMDSGIAVMALYAQNYETYMEKARQYASEISQLDEQIATDPYNVDLLSRREELLQEQQSAILAAQDERDAIVDLISEGYDKELESLQDLIDKYNDIIDAAADLRSYQKDIEEQVKNISALEKQLNALSGDTSEENKKTLQELRVSLDEANSDLEDTQYDKYISDQKDLLNNLYSEYEILLNARLDNVDALISESVDAINASSDNICTTITNQADSVGYTLSDAMQSIWTSGSEKIDAIFGADGSLQNTFTGINSMVSNIYNAMSTNAQSIISAINSSTTTANGTGETKTTTSTSVGASNVSGGSSGSGSSGSGSSSSGSSGSSSKSGSSGSSGGSSSKSSSSSSSSKSSSSSSSSKSSYKVSTISSTLKRGSSGSNVKTLQKALNSLGFKGKNGKALSVDGKFGEGTEYAVKNFQGSYKWYGAIPQDGVVGKKTKWKFSCAGFKTGVKDLPEDQIAWINEMGPEAIIRPSENAILAPLQGGDSVLNARATDNLWNMANSPAEFIRNSVGLPPTLGSSAIQNDVSVSISLPNVKDYADFMNSLKNDSKFESLIRSITIDQLAGKSPLRKYNYSW